MANLQEQRLIDWVRNNLIGSSVLKTAQSICFLKKQIDKENVAENYEIILKIGANGEVVNIFLSIDSKIEDCFSNIISNHKMPIPPVVPAYVTMSIDINIPESDESIEPSIESIIDKGINSLF